MEQQQHWQPGRQAPGYNEQCAQLTAARAEYDWLKAGSQTVQQLGVPPACGGALRDFAQAMRNFFHGRDWVEKTSTDLARRFDTIRVEDLKVRAMTRSARGTADCPGTSVAQKRGLNREISRQGWGLLVARLKHKAQGRLEFVPAA